MGIDVCLSAGQVIAIRGASGSGKSTLLRCLALLEARAKGEILFHEKPVADQDVPAYRRSVVFVGQTPPRFTLTVVESMSLPFQFHSAHGELDRGHATAMCQRLLLPAAILDRSLADLSGGEAQRVALIRALLLDPTVLLLDEPTSALDPEASHAVGNLIREWLDGDERAAIIVTHTEQFTRDLATDHASLDNGAMTWMKAE